MSVPKDSRKEGKLALAVMARGHAKYVIQITSNPKVFDPKYSHAVTDDIINEAKSIYRYIRAANDIVVRSKENYADRRTCQQKAVRLCNTLLADMEIAKSIFHLIRNKTRAWIESDAERYKKYR